VSDNSRAITAAVLGAIGGALAGYLLFTDRGRTLRRQLEGAIEETAGELHRFGITVRRAAGFANDGWKLMNEAFGDGVEYTKSLGKRQSGPH
jgi:hypothetical protein